jgi:predicted nucleotidyltransferase
MATNKSMRAARRQSAAPPPSLADFLFGTYRRDALALLLMHPAESWHVREIARLTGRPANSMYRELNALAQAGLLRRRAQGNQVHYSANPECPIYEELRGILRKTAGIADVLRDALAPLKAKIHAAFVYGSVAGGTERAGSDVDVMIVGSISFEEAVRILTPAEETLRREVNPHVYGLREFRSKIAAREPFLLRVLNGPKIYLVGGANDIGKPGGHRAAQAA